MTLNLASKVTQSLPDKIFRPVLMHSTYVDKEYFSQDKRCKEWVPFLTWWYEPGQASGSLVVLKFYLENLLLSHEVCLGLGP